MNKKIPITRLRKFFDENDLSLDINMGQEWLYEDMNFKCVLYKVDRVKTKSNNVYGEVKKDQVVFHPPVEFNALVEIMEPDNKFISNTKINQVEPGNIKIEVYIDTLESLDVDIEFGDYIGYYENEYKVRYYSVINDGRVFSDNKHTYGGYKAFYRTIIATPVSEDEFRGL